MAQDNLSWGIMPKPEIGSDKWLKERHRVDKSSPRTHALYWYTTTVVWMITEKYGLDNFTALRRFLFSETYAMLCDDRLEMWDYSPDEMFDLWECEQITGNPRNSRWIRGDIR